MVGKVGLKRKYFSFQFKRLMVSFMMLLKQLVQLQLHLQIYVSQHFVCSKFLCVVH